jgi:hypothetical protein
LVESAVLRHVIILSDADESDQPSDRLTIRVDRAERVFVKQLRLIPGVAVVEIEREGPFPTIHLRAGQRMAALARIEALCRDNGLQVLDIVKRI